MFIIVITKQIFSTAKLLQILFFHLKRGFYIIVMLINQNIFFIS